jgi:glycosyltransferase involved in cell wall biosynthesis
MKRKKILFLSDAVSSTSGLARITRDLALRVNYHLDDIFEVASVGYGSPGSASIPFKEYHLHSVENWLVPELPQVWNDFVGDDEGILMCVWDLSRLYWLGIPQTCPIPQLRQWVENAKIKKWAYHAIDAEGPNGHLPYRIAQTMKGFDRVLDYSAFSSKITGNPDHLPHGIDTEVFYPRPLKEARELFIKQGFQGLTPGSLLVGIVATNQARKNWQLGMETCRILLDRGHDVHLWVHTDVLSRHWSIGDLIVDYGLQGRAAVTVNRFTDEQMAWMYSACDVTLGIGPEGFGYPIAESLACGVPCICGSYGAQAEFVPKDMQVDPIAYYYEGAFCSKRPVHAPGMWADCTEKWVKYGRQMYMTNPPTSMRRNFLPPKINWNGSELWPAWRSWFEKGLA